MTTKRNDIQRRHQALSNNLQQTLPSASTSTAKRINKHRQAHQQALPDASTKHRQAHPTIFNKHRQAHQTTAPSGAVKQRAPIGALQRQPRLMHIATSESIDTA
ncbi:MAG: hypothetical protein HUK00_01585 [Bacteroidaceae bacterium]|nr:hypothetical protein [Bacteroidaceae bacterium]